MTAARPAFIKLIALWISCLCLAFGGAAQASSKSGWWWNANESGRGFFIEVIGDWMFLSAYFYDTDGRATWLVSNDPMPDPNVYEGRLLALRGGQSLTGNYRAPNAPTVPGNIRVQFADDTHATMTWPGGVVAIERYAFSSPTSATFRPQTGWWWNPDESGRGFSIELQGSHMFIGAYMYDESGNPVWYVADALMTSPTRFEAPLLRFSGGQTLTGGYRRPNGPTSAGSIIVDFSSAVRASVTLSDGALPGLAGKSITRFGVEKQKLRPPFAGTFSHTVALSTALVEFKGSAAWRLSDLVNSPYDGGAIYIVENGSVEATYQGQVTPGDNCSGRIVGNGSHKLQPGDGSFTLFPTNRYSGSLRFTVEITAKLCDGTPLTVPWPVSIPLAGSLKDGDMWENPPAIDSQDGTTVNRWQFFGS